MQDIILAFIGGVITAWASFLLIIWSRNEDETYDEDEDEIYKIIKRNEDETYGEDETYKVEPLEYQ